MKRSLSKGYKVAEFPAHRDSHRKAAGPIRNKDMAKYAFQYGRGLLIAFWGKSKGICNMIDLAREYGLHVIVKNY